MDCLAPNGVTKLLSSFPDLSPGQNRPAAVLGLGAFGHDAAVALVDANDGQVIFATAEERLSNRKHDWHFPIGSVKQACGLARDRGFELQAVAVNFRAEEFVTNTLFAEIDRIVADVATATAIRAHLLARFSSDDYFEVDPPNEAANTLLTLLHQFDVAPAISSELILRITWYWNWGIKYRKVADTIRSFVHPLPVHFVNHHNSHAASAYFNSGFKDACVVVIDGTGEADTVSISSGESGRLTRLGQSQWPHSLGIFYLFATQHLGFQHGDEYKVMGMSAYGEPAYYDVLSKMMSVKPNGELRFKDTAHFKLGNLGPHGHLVYQFTSTLHGLIPPRSAGDPIVQQHFDFAASVQLLTEQIGVQIVRNAINLTGHRNVALAGGVGLNGLMNEQIRRLSGCDDLFVFPAAADDGCAVGAAQLIVSEQISMPQKQLKSCYFGREIATGEVEDLLSARNIIASKPESIHREIAQALADGKIVARCVGRAEFGPRALGNRSLLAHPGFADMKNILNARVKHREEFRPFAPACLVDSVNKYFELDRESPYMLLIGQAREITKELAPAVVHHDGTARVQSVSPDVNADFFNTIVAFEQITGLPIVINTSFNLNGEAIVDTAEDALESFSYMDVDYLALGDYWIAKKDNPNNLTDLPNDEYLAIRKQRFAELELGPLGAMDIEKFAPAFTPSAEAIEALVKQQS